MYVDILTPLILGNLFIIFLSMFVALMKIKEEEPDEEEPEKE